ncbi:MULTISPECIES: hypothetical protein [unclassified Variovorax]|uniref:hypothetical protein n=1 Tax=unclassified Variovorax TaxID=663243 RepID=UPI00131888AE|nr:MULTISPECIES: hypothetical protein [unclassified Variovorax]VTU42646.1 hypothetical protein H6P1_00243 [Variovorax sp. PBL-H6]VTU43781.1 hypothetical protein SRS16P1_00660 [Variovorax sp. SRS16]VTU43846.1 hypothetical protein E5P1_00653 [Variovorax sp. PBL-E5]
MVYDFKVVSSTKIEESEQAYFFQLQRNAERALAADAVQAGDALAACEYMDCVDGGDLEMDKSVYRQCTSLVMSYMFSVEKKVAEALTAKSWAAKTLFGLLTAQNEQFEDLPTFQMVA